MRRLLSCLFFVIVWTSVVLAEDKGKSEPDFNRYMLNAYKMLYSTRKGLGYNEHKWFTRDLNYGTLGPVIKAKDKSGETMCNAAVTETLIEAINLYAQDNKDWAPEAVVPPTSFDKSDWTLLRTHLFSHDYMDYKPFAGHLREFPDALKRKFTNFHSKGGMSIALQKFGIGKIIKFKDMKPGDVISFSRSFVNIEGKPGGAGHSAIFLAYLDKNQKELSQYDASKVVGFKYFSSQGQRYREGLIGLDHRWAYFNGFCPFKPGYRLPEDPKLRGCADAVDNEINRARFPASVKEHLRDCCVIRSGDYPPRVGRVLAPNFWTYQTAQLAVARAHAELQRELKEYLHSRERAKLTIALISQGVRSAERRQSSDAGRFHRDVKTRFYLDIKAVSPTGDDLAIDLKAAREIQRATPRSVIQEANARVTPADQRAFEKGLRERVDALVAEAVAAAETPVPNLKLDGVTTD